MKIVDVKCHVLLDPDYNIGATSSAQDDIVVEIITDEGLIGIGESDVNPWIARACIEAPGTHTMGRGITELLIGRDPLDVEAIWEELYVGTAMNGRRGAVIHAIGAVDMALHDLRGKALGKPCHQLLGGAVRDRVTPYASLQPDQSSFDSYKASLVEWALKAQGLGFVAAKLEVTLAGAYAHLGLNAEVERMAEVIEAVRGAVGPDMTLMVDAQYSFTDADSCLAAIREWEPYDVYFLETPLPSDDVEGYARLVAEQPIPIAQGEWLATRFEFEELLRRGAVSVVQPDIGRVGGLTEASRVVRAATDANVPVVPHIWKTGISIAAGIHLAATTESIPFLEFLPRDLSSSNLRRSLIVDDFTMDEGRLVVPSTPGLGIELDRDALERFATVVPNSA
ncbi:mandelate racemase/muconate lactonizing enzyme family protein [Nonomuraea antimicrobica]|uniref:Mandelate racemase/muconate lactonizing enzyme family protein n=1 Tax=Nonomuraea antimicrobica TaxID=561173 RepID=A0ABP7CYU8_9ACTN